MALFDDFAHDLHTALTHLYDPRYQPPALLCAGLGVEADVGVAEIQRKIIASIALLQPTDDTPPTARSRRLHTLLTYRYLQELTQEESAQQLGITPRHLRREQQQAIEALAQRLWEQWQRGQRPLAELPAHTAPPVSPAAPPAGFNRDGTDPWRNQVRQEVALLQRHVPGAVTDLAQALAGITAVGNQLAEPHNVLLQVVPPPSTLLAYIHPSALRQIVLAAIEKLCVLLNTGQITLTVMRDGDAIKLTIQGEPCAQPQAVESELIREIVQLQAGRMVVAHKDQRVAFQIWLPKADRVQVLVVDDNEDLVHFYRRYTAQTRYELVQLADGADLLATAKRLQPALILLDVMLPDVDGWELLRHLRADPATNLIPVIVCSVVRRVELAVTLGASHYLVKPVGRQELIAALDLVYAQAVEKIGPT